MSGAGSGTGSDVIWQSAIHCDTHMKRAILVNMTQAFTLSDFHYRIIVTKWIQDNDIIVSFIQNLVKLKLSAGQDLGSCLWPPYHQGGQQGKKGSTTYINV